MNIIYTEKQIKKAIKQDVKIIEKECDLTNPLYICIMNGAVKFFTGITSFLPSGVVHYCRTSSYENGAEGHEVKLENMDPPEVDSPYSCVLIIDDICDTGNTLKVVYNYYSNICKITKGCYIKTITLINRKNVNNKQYSPDYAMLQNDTDIFFAGYGLDNRQKDRNLNYVYEIPKKEIEEWKE